MSSEADSTREVKKSTSKLKIFWETYKSFDDLYSGSMMVLGFTACALGIQTLGFVVLSLCKWQLVVFFSKGSLIIGIFASLILLAILIIIGFSLKGISIFTTRFNETKEKYE